MKRIVQSVILLGMALVMGITCQQSKSRDYTMTLFLFHASHRGNEQALPLFPGETSVQTVQTVLRNSEEIMQELQRTFGYSRIQMEDFRRLRIHRESDGRYYFLRMGNYFVRVLLLQKTQSTELPVNISVFSSHSITLPPGADAVHQLYTAAAAIEKQVPLFSVRVTVPVNESVILGRAMQEDTGQALFVALQLESETPQKASAQTPAEGQYIVYHNRRELQKYLQQKPVTSVTTGDSIPNLVPFQLLTVKPLLVKRAMPEYPERLRREGKEGRVIVKILVNEKGNVTRAMVIKKSQYPEFDQAALAAARQFVFQPGRLGNKAVKVWLTVPFMFRLNKNSP